MLVRALGCSELLTTKVELLKSIAAVPKLELERNESVKTF
jgi:hypothetical protein